MAASVRVKGAFVDELLREMNRLGVSEMQTIVALMEANLASNDDPEVRFAQCQEYVFRIGEIYRKLSRGCRRGLRTFRDENASKESLSALLGRCAVAEEAGVDTDAGAEQASAVEVAHGRHLCDYCHAGTHQHKRIVFALHWAQGSVFSQTQERFRIAFH